MESQMMLLETDAVSDSGLLDSRYTCDIDNSSPQLMWSHFPDQTAGFALLAEDQDGPQGIQTQWVVYNIPSHIHHLPAGIPPQEALPNGILQGINSFGKLGYAGPCPPMGDPPHHYVFRLFALKALPKIGRRLTRYDLLQAIQPEIIAVAETGGIYRRAIQRAG